MRLTKIAIQIAALIAPAILPATYFGNPGQPGLLTDGLLKSPPSWYCLRAGYMTDWLYRQPYKEEFHISGTVNPPTYAKLWTDAATITLNLKNWIDINVQLGSSQIQIDHELFSKRQFSWGIGSKWLIYQSDVLFVGLDLKYFESQQKPLYFVSEGYAFDIVSDFKLNYTEMQAALGAAYRTEQICPYLYLTYLYSKIEPTPLTVAVQVPYYDMVVDTTSRSVICKRRWGMAVGGTIIGGTKGSVSIESRFFNQNAINISGEIRF